MLMMFLPGDSHDARSRWPVVEKSLPADAHDARSRCPVVGVLPADARDALSQCRCRNSAS